MSTETGNALTRWLGALVRPREKQLSHVPSRGWWPIIKEPFSGAWQRNISEKHEALVCYPTLYACISRIAQDIGKLTFLLKREGDNEIWKKTDNPAYSPVLRKPNHYQTQQQFRESWMLSKLMQGNAYIMKQRDERGVVVKLYPLDPNRVKPLISESGDVFYELWLDNLNLVAGFDQDQNLIVPAREIIHDREVTLHHPLIGIPPLCAAYWPAVKNMRILKSSAEFFANGASPGGILAAPGSISDETAERLSRHWNENFTGENSGRVAVVGDGLKYEQLAENAADSQLVEQMRYSDEQICQPFGVPPFIIGIGTIPAGLKVDDMTNMYYSFALQARIEHMEALLDEGLAIHHPLGVELDTWPLLRMDRQKLATVEGQLVKDGISTPNEGRRMFDKPPIEGGDTVYLQQQQYSIQALYERDQDKPFSDQGRTTDPAPAAGDAGDAAASGSIQQEALNSAQVTALQGIIFAVAQGQLDAETARALIGVAFPLVSADQIDAMLANAVDAPAVDPPPTAEPEQSAETNKAIALLWQEDEMVVAHA